MREYPSVQSFSQTKNTNNTVMTDCSDFYVDLKSVAQKAKAKVACRPNEHSHKS